MAGVVPALVLYVVAIGSFRLLALALRHVFGRDQAARLERWLVDDDDGEHDYAFPKHRFLFLVDACWVLGVVLAVWFMLPGSYAGPIAGVAAALVSHAVGRSPLFVLFAPTLLVAPAIVAGVVTFVSR